MHQSRHCSLVLAVLPSTPSGVHANAYLYAILCNNENEPRTQHINEQLLEHCEGTWNSSGGSEGGASAETDLDETTLHLTNVNSRVHRGAHVHADVRAQGLEVAS